MPKMTTLLVEVLLIRFPWPENCWQLPEHLALKQLNAKLENCEHKTVLMVALNGFVNRSSLTSALMKIPWSVAGSG